MVASAAPVKMEVNRIEAVAKFGEKKSCERWVRTKIRLTSRELYNRASSQSWPRLRVGLCNVVGQVATKQHVHLAKAHHWTEFSRPHRVPGTGSRVTLKFGTRRGS